MTSSGVATFDPTLSDIITMAYRATGTLGIEQTASAVQLVNGRNLLNMMLKAWSATGMHCWTVEEGILFLQKSQSRYSLGLASTDHMTDAYDFASTTLSAAEAAGQTDLSVTSITGIANGDYLGIELDDGTMQWTTVNGAPSGTTVTAAVALTGAAASGNRVVAYTSKLIRPLKIVNARSYYYSDEREVEMVDLSHLDYQRLPSKTTAASPVVQWAYQPKLPLGIVNVWTDPADVDYAMRFTWHRPIYDFTATTETADVPAEWQEALVFNLAHRLIPSTGCPAARSKEIKELASQAFAIVFSHDREWHSTLFQPSDEGWSD